MSEAEKCRAILEKDPTDIQAFVSLCRIAEQDEDFPYLAELYKFRAEVIRDAQEIADLYYKAAEIYLEKLVDTTAAVEALLQGFEHDRTHAGIGDRLDFIYREAGDWEATLQVLEQRLEALGVADVQGVQLTIRSDLHQQAGEIWDKVYNDKTRALAEYTKAIEFDKSNVLALYGAREIYYGAGQHKNAAKLCELEARAEKDPERRVALYRELGHILSIHLQEPEQAVLAIKRALKVNPDNNDTKQDLAETIALVPLTEENRKDHRWASDYLATLAEDADPLEAQELARSSFLALPTNLRAVEALENLAKTSPNPTALCDFYKYLVDAVPDINVSAPVIRLLAKHYATKLDRPEDAIAWLRKIASLGNPEDAWSIAKLERDLETKSVQGSTAPFGDEKPSESFSAVDRGLGEDSWTGVPAAPVDMAAEDDLMDVSNITSPGSFAIPEENFRDLSTVATSFTSNALSNETRALAQREKKPSALRHVSEPPSGISTEEWVAQLHAQADAARRTGDDATAEKKMLTVFEYSPYDQKATTYLERRFRARSDWSRLRDLLMRAANSPHLPSAVQTVRLREAARISEEQLGDMEGAIEAWQTIRENEPRVRDAVDALSRLLAEAGRWEELLDIIRAEAETTKSKAKTIEGYQRIAEIYRVRVGDLNAAALAYVKVLELSPDDAQAMDALDDIYQRQERWSELVPLLQRRAESARDRGEKRDLLYRGAQILKERMPHHEASYALAKEILAFAPRDNETLLLMASIDEEAGQWARLLSVLDMQVQAADEPALKASVLRRKAEVAAQELLDPRVAIKAWREVLCLLPGDQEAFDSLAAIYENSGDYRELVEVWRESLPFAKSDLSKADIYRQMARVLESELGVSDEAVDCWRQVQEIDEDDESLGALSRYYERIGDWSELVEVLGRQAPYAESPGQRADVLFKRAMLLVDRLGDREQAERDLTQILTEIDPSHIPTMELLRRIFVEDKRYDKAVETLEHQIAYSEDSTYTVPLLVQLGDWCRHELQDLPKAMDAFEKAAALQPDEIEVLETLEEIYVDLSEWDRQLKLLYGRSKRTQDHQDKLALLLRGAGVCEERLSDPPKAWTWYREIFDTLWPKEEILDIVVGAATRHGLWRELIDVYVAMVGRTPDEDDQMRLWLKVADIFEVHLSDPAGALEAVLRAFGLRPDEAELLDMVDKLAVASCAWPRLSTVYGVLVKRAADAPRRISLLTRYARVLLDQGKQASSAFDVSLKALEVDLHSEELLALVEEMARASERYVDLVRVYGVCGRMATDPNRRADLSLRAFEVIKQHLDDHDSAMNALVGALLANPFDPQNTQKVWQGVEAIEKELMPEKQGVFWQRLVETYLSLVQEFKNDRPHKVELLVAMSRIYLERMKKPTEGFSCLKNAQILDPKDDTLNARLEQVAGDHGLWKELSDHYQEVLDETFEMPVATLFHRRKARILEEILGRPADAAEHYWQIIQLDASDRVGFEKLLAYYENAGKWNELANLLEGQLDGLSNPQDKRAMLLRIAKVWEEKIRNRFEAKDWYQHILVLYPGDADATMALERLGGMGTRISVSEPGDDDEEDDEDEEMRELISIPPPPMTPSQEPPLTEGEGDLELDRQQESEAQESSLEELPGESFESPDDLSGADLLPGMPVEDHSFPGDLPSLSDDLPFPETIASKDGLEESEKKSNDAKVSFEELLEGIDDD
jgi:tetratricopeptide (TPR) repeat protein